MHICFLCVGGFVHIEPYLKYFKKAGHNVSFITLAPHSDIGIKTYDLSLWGSYSATEGKWKYPISMLRAYRLIKKIKPDIVHTHYVTSAGLAGVVCGFHPTITTVHGSDLNDSIDSKIWKLLLKLVFNHADCVNTCTKDQKRKVISLGVAPEKIQVLTLGVDTEIFCFKQRQKLRQGQKIRMVTTRRLEKIYNHVTIIKALKILKSKNVYFKMTFVADGALLEELKELAELQGVSEKITFLGGVDKSKINSILSENDIFISSPIRDGISVALLEAMASGLFPVVSEIDTNSDWLTHGVNGFLHKVNDPESLANCIMDLYDNDLIVRATQLNREKVVKLADTQTNMKILEGIYEEMILKAKSKE